MGIFSAEVIFEIKNQLNPYETDYQMSFTNEFFILLSDSKKRFVYEKLAKFLDTPQLKSLTRYQKIDWKISSECKNLLNFSCCTNTGLFSDEKSIL